MSFPNLSAWAVRERSLTLFFMLLSILAGIQAFVSLGRAEDPAFVVRAMMVSAVWPGATTEQIQDQVVNRLEKRIQEVENIYRIDSRIRPGRADLLVEFQDYTPSAKVPSLFYDVRRRMQEEAPTLPPGVVGPLVNEDFADVYFSLLALTAPGLPARELSREAEAVRDRLRRMEGVHKVMLLGERREQVFIEFDMARLNHLGLTPQALLDGIDANNRLLPAGALELNGPRAFLRVNADLANPERLAAVPVRVGDRLLRLSDLADIRQGYEEPPGYQIRAGGEDALLLGVVMQKGENGLQFGERLTQFLDAERQRLPLGISLAAITNQTEAISAAVNLFQIKFLIAMAVVMAVSIAAIGLRAGLVVGIAVPVTLGLTLLLMLASGMNLNRITLGALIIALGLLVDDAIIAIEMMIMKMEEGWDRVRAASHAWTVTAAPMLSGTLVTAIGFVPIGFARSAVGEYAGGIFWVLGYALLMSWLVAVIFTPWLGVKLLPAQLKSHTAAGVSPFHSPAYQRLRALVGHCVQWRRSVVAVTVALLVLAGVGMAKVVEKQFFPTSDRTEVLVNVFLAPGSDISRTEATTRRLEAALSGLPEVRSLSAYIGAGAPRFFISANPEPPDPAFARLIAIGRDVHARERIIAELERRIAEGEFPEARIRVSRLLYGPPVEWPVSFRVVGTDPQVMRDIAYQVRTIMASHRNVRDAHLEWDSRVPVLHIGASAETLRLSGLTPRDLANQLQFQLDGVPVTEVRQDIRGVTVIARGLPDPQQPFDSLQVRTQEGHAVSLQQLGPVTVDYEEPLIRRYNRERILTVQSEVEGAQPPDVTKALWAQLATLRTQLPEGYRLETGGSVEQSSKADASIQKLQPLMVALMLVVIMIQMRSFTGTFVVLATAPLGLIGAVIALLAFQKPFGFVALLGLIGLAGILMRNTMILTQQVQDSLNHGMNPRDAVIEAAVQRARPVILTALAAALAFIPLTLDGFWGPMACVLIGGVLVGTVITLLFVPALYALLFKLPKATN